jgi:hypothetical protein
LPFYKFFEKDSETPKGALILHFVTTLVYIVVAPVSSDGYTFTIGIYTYGYLIIGSEWSFLVFAVSVATKLTDLQFLSLSESTCYPRGSREQENTGNQRF